MKYSVSSMKNKRHAELARHCSHMLNTQTTGRVFAPPFLYRARAPHCVRAFAYACILARLLAPVSFRLQITREG